MKQSAVEFLAKSLKDFPHIKHSFRFKELVEQAKEMEKKQNQREMSDKNKETELLRASLMQQVSELNDDEIIYLYDELSEFFKTKER